MLALFLMQFSLEFSVSILLLEFISRELVYEKSLEMCLSILLLLELLMKEDVKPLELSICPVIVCILCNNFRSVISEVVRALSWSELCGGCMH